MIVRSVIAAIFSLLFQWAQVAHSADLKEDCRDVSAVHCECCADLPSCPCAKDGDSGPERIPLPILPDSHKLPAAKPAEPRIAFEVASAAHAPRAVFSHPACGPVPGYAGVRLSVALRSIVV